MGQHDKCRQDPNNQTVANRPVDLESTLVFKVVPVINYAENGFYSSGHKVLIFTVFVTSKTDASKDENDVEGDGPVPQHGRDQGKGETPEDAAKKDEISNFTLLLPAFQDG